ncbi:MAG: M48 family metalloprotease [Methylobacillus sp.]|nr:M48 family metalloprotease [Methylobacillus sp.]
MKFVYLFLMLLCAPVALADGLPDLGDPAQTALTPQDERRIGEEIMRDVNNSNDVISDVEVVDYLQGLGYRLASNSGDLPQKFTFFVVNDPSINAFALPGSIIGVNSGLITAVDNESELASVVSHEIGHVVQHHIARMMAKQKQNAWQSFAAMAFALLAARSNPQLAGGTMEAAAAGSIQQQLDYTREHEREADRVGLQILDSAGFDTRAMPAFFEKLMKGTRFSEGIAPSFLRTHPLTTERIADTRNRAEQTPYRQVADSAGFNFARARIRAITGNANHAVEWFQSVLKEKRYVDEASQHYGYAVALVRANKLADARAEIAWLRDHAPRNPMTESLAANLLMATGDMGQAETRYKQGLAAYPNYRGLIYGYADLLLATNQPDAMLKLIADKQQAYPDDAHLYELKSQAYTRQGKQLLRHQAQGEAYFRQYDLRGAIEQMELATRSPDGDFYQKSSVEARLKQLRAMLDEPSR